MFNEATFRLTCDMRISFFICQSKNITNDYFHWKVETGRPVIMFSCCIFEFVYTSDQQKFKKDWNIISIQPLDLF